MSISLVVLPKMSNSMRYNVVTNSHIAFNYIHIKFWVVNDAMVLDMKTNLLIWRMIYSNSRLRNSHQVRSNCLWCLRIVVFFFLKQMHESGRSIISINMIISSDMTNNWDIVVIDSNSICPFWKSKQFIGF